MEALQQRRRKFWQQPEAPEAAWPKPGSQSQSGSPQGGGTSRVDDALLKSPASFQGGVSDYSFVEAHSGLFEVLAA